MHTLRLLILSLGALCAPTPLGAQQPRNPMEQLGDAQRALFEQVAPSVVSVSHKTKSGTGFFVDTHGLILTNRHVVEAVKSVDVGLFGGRRVKGEVVALAAGDLDLALVQIDAQETPPLPFRDVNTLHIGEWAGSVNQGSTGGWTYTTGMISNLHPYPDSKPLIQTQLPLNPGSSGAPLFDARGRVLGVVMVGAKSANSVNFAIRIDEAVEVLPMLAERAPVLIIEAPARAPIFVDGVMVGVGPRLILNATAKTYDIFTLIDGKKVTAAPTFPATRRVKLAPPPP